MLKLFKIILASLFIILNSYSEISAQVVINELGILDSPDWVELYAYEDTDISGWYLDDEDTETVMVPAIASGTIIGPSTNPFMVFNVSTRLNNSGDIIKLFKADDTLVETIPYGSKGGVCLPSSSGGSVGKTTDGGNVFERFSVSTKELSNQGGTLDHCPTPTPEPTPTNTPTPEPTATTKPTSTPKPTNTVTPKPAVKAASTGNPTATNKPEISSEEGKRSEDVVLGVRGVSSSTPIDKVEESRKGKFPLTAGLFILGGISFIGLAAYPVIKNRKKRYNENGDSKTNRELS